ncbi:MAG TPA: hypothetical protein VGH74_03645, partial [Planctomycetaceae bacterium]
MDAAKVLHSLIITGVTLFPVGVAAQTPAWSGGTTAPTGATNYDRYGQPITSAPATISQRTQNGISQTGNAMRDGVEAGIQQANDQISRGASQAWDSTRNAVTGQQSSTAPAFGSTPSTTTSPWPATPSAASSAPGWPSNSTAGRGAAATSSNVTPVDGGWTSIGTSVPSPPLLVPQSPMQSPTTTNFGGNSNGTATRNTTTYPAVAASEQTPLHSVLADPSRSPTSANKPEETWPTNWNNNGTSQPAAIGRNSSPSSLGSTVRDPDLVPLANNNGTTPQDSRGPMIGRPNEGFSNTNPWNQSEQNSGAASNGAGNGKTTFAGFGNPSSSNAPNNQMGSGQFAGQANNAIGNNQMGNGQMQNGQMQNGQNGSNY